MNKATLFMNAGWAGLAGIAIWIVGNFAAIPDGIGLTGSLITIAACWVMLFTRNADEYTSGLWTAAASLAFATLLILFLALPFFEGVYDGFNAAHAGDGKEPQQDIPIMASIACAIGAFYVGLFWKRFRGDY